MLLGRVSTFFSNSRFVAETETLPYATERSLEQSEFKHLAANRLFGVSVPRSGVAGNRLPRIHSSRVKMCVVQNKSLDFGSILLRWRTGMQKFHWEERGEESPVHAKEKVLCFEAAPGNFGWKWPSGQVNTLQRCFIDS